MLYIIDIYIYKNLNDANIIPTALDTNTNRQNE